MFICKLVGQYYSIIKYSLVFAPAVVLINYKLKLDIRVVYFFNIELQLYGFLKYDEFYDF